MKFLKRALIIVAALGVILVPSVAWAQAGDAVPENKWMLFPDDGFPDPAEFVAAGVVTASVIPIRGVGQSLRRNQKAWMAFYDVGGDIFVNRDGASTECTLGTDCSSAPLFISSETATFCIDSDTSDPGAGTGTVTVHRCGDSTCDDDTSGPNQGILVEAPLTACGAGGAIEENIIQPRIGGQWFFITLTGDTANDEKLGVWVVGQ